MEHSLRMLVAQPKTGEVERLKYCQECYDSERKKRCEKGYGPIKRL